MSTILALLLLPFLLWLAAWRLLGDRNGWLALANAWAWWLLTAAIPGGLVALWRRSRLNTLLWGSGVAASRLPFALTGFWAYPGFEPFAARVTLALPHPTIPSSLLDVYCVQFISPTNEVRRVGPTALLRLRERQIDWVLSEIERRGEAAIVAGDWNTTEGSDAYRQATERLVDGWREAGNGPGWSWPRSLNPYVDRSAPPVLRLDYTMHTGRRFAPGVAVAEMRVIRDGLGSDHCPLLARVAVGDVARQLG